MSIIFDALQKTQQQRSKIVDSITETGMGKTTRIKLVIITAVMLLIFAELVIKPTLKSSTVSATAPSISAAPLPKLPVKKLTATIAAPQVAVTKPTVETNFATAAKSFVQSINPLASKPTPVAPPTVKAASSPHHPSNQHHLTLNGVLVSGSDKIAMIDNHPLEIGESISDDVSRLTVTKISEHSVELKDKDHTITIDDAS